METTRITVSDGRLGESTINEPAINQAGSEWNARGLRPIAHWVLMPTSGGGSRLSMVWEVPNPMPPGSGA